MKNSMDYERLLKTIKNECNNRGISLYQLSKLSSVPISTIYGIFNYKNKAQIDTLCAMLNVLDLQLSIIPMANRDEEKVTGEAGWLKDWQELTLEKRTLIKTLIRYLKD